MYSSDLRREQTVNWRSVLGQVGRGFEQPDLVEDVPAHGRGVGLGDL